MPQNQPGCFRDPIWTFLGVLIAFVALLFAVFIWVVPNYKVLFPTQQITSTPPQVTSDQQATTTPSQTTSPKIPLLAGYSYSGTGNCHGVSCYYDIDFSFQDQQGNLKGSALRKRPRSRKVDKCGTVLGRMG
jgi:hypothetical protein